MKSNIPACLTTWVAIVAALLAAGVDGSAAGSPTNSPAPSEKQATRSFVPPPAVNFREPAREYVERPAAGRTFHVERDLAERQPDLAQRAIDRLASRISQTLGLLPEHARERLGRLSFFVMLGPEAPGGGRDNGAEFFRRTDPDYHAALDPRWRSAVVIYSASNYLSQNEHWSVQLLLHEFAHAWQLEQWPEKQPQIHNAWQSARAAGLYRAVKDVNGTVLESAYARINQLEYFAELSCAYFWRGEYEPFDRDALRSYDPAGFAMVETMWGVQAPPPAPSENAGRNE